MESWKNRILVLKGSPRPVKEKKSENLLSGDVIPIFPSVYLELILLL